MYTRLSNDDQHDDFVRDALSVVNKKTMIHININDNNPDAGYILHQVSYVLSIIWIKY